MVNVCVGEGGGEKELSARGIRASQGTFSSFCYWDSTIPLLPKSKFSSF